MNSAQLGLFICSQWGNLKVGRKKGHSAQIEKGIFWCFLIFSRDKKRSCEPSPFLSVSPLVLTDRFTRVDTCKSRQAH